MTDDLWVCIKLESIAIGLPLKHPADQSSAYEDIGHSNFPAAGQLSKVLLSEPTLDFIKTSSFQELSLSSVAWLLRFHPELLSLDFLRALVEAGRYRAVKMIYAKLQVLTSHEWLPLWVYLHGSKGAIAAVGSGNLELVKFLFCEGVLHSQNLNSAICEAAREGHLPVVRYFFSLLYANEMEEIKERAGVSIIEAARKGHRHVVEYLLPRSERDYLPIALTSAAKEGHLDVVRLLNERTREPAQANAMDLAKRNGHSDVFEYLFHHTNARCSIDLLHSLLQTPELYANIPRLLDRCNEKKKKLQKETLELAVRTQRLDIVLKLLKHDMDITWGNAIDVAAQLGQDDMLEFFYERFKSTLLSGTVMDIWAGMGQLDGIKFLERGLYCGCTAAAIKNATESGHRHVVKYLVEVRGEVVTEEISSWIRSTPKRWGSPWSESSDESD